MLKHKNNDCKLSIIEYYSNNYISLDLDSLL